MTPNPNAQRVIRQLTICAAMDGYRLIYDALGPKEEVLTDLEGNPATFPDKVAAGAAWRSAIAAAAWFRTEEML